MLAKLLRDELDRLIEEYGFDKPLPREGSVSIQIQFNDGKPKLRIKERELEKVTT